MKHALVTGAPGFVGSYLCKELLEAGYSVKALHRKSSNLSALRGLKGLELVEGDITDIASLYEAFKNVDVVFHIAALFRQAKFHPSVYYQVNTEGTRNVLETAKAVGVSRVIHCSTTGVHGGVLNPPATEEEPYRPGDVYQQSKCEAEKLALSYFRSGQIQGCVIRPAMIWGPGDTRFLKLFNGVAKGRFPLIGGGKVLTHWILVDDLARSFRLAAELPELTGQIYTIAGDRPVTLRYVVECIADRLGVAPPRLYVPVLPLEVLAAALEFLCVPFGIEPPLHRRRMHFFTNNRAFDCSKAKRELGFQTARSFEDELALVCDWYVAQGLVKLPENRRAEVLGTK